MVSSPVSFWKLPDSGKARFPKHFVQWEKLDLIPRLCAIDERFGQYCEPLAAAFYLD